MKLLRLVFEFLQDVGHGGEPLALEVLDASGVGQLGQLGVDGHPGQELQAVGLGGGLGLALAEEGDLLPASGQIR